MKVFEPMSQRHGVVCTVFSETVFNAPCSHLCAYLNIQATIPSSATQCAYEAVDMARLIGAGVTPNVVVAADFRLVWRHVPWPRLETVGRTCFRRKRRFASRSDDLIGTPDPPASVEYSVDTLGLTRNLRRQVSALKKGSSSFECSRMQWRPFRPAGKSRACSLGATPPQFRIEAWGGIYGQFNLENPARLQKNDSLPGDHLGLASAQRGCVGLPPITHPIMSAELMLEVKKTIVEAAWLKISPSEIANDCPLYGPGGLGLESIDMTTLIFDLEKRFSIRIPEDPEVVKNILHTASSIRDEILRQRQST